MQNETTLKHNDLLNRACSICGSVDREVVFDLSTENIVGIRDGGHRDLINVCNSCGFMYSAPLPPESLILKYYELMSNYEHPESSGIRPIEDVKQVKRQIDIILERFPKGFSGKALDIGCSIAYGLSLLQERGWNVLGLDPSDKCVEISKNKLNVNVVKGFFSFELLSGEKPFDVIILSHVLEHVIYPEKVLGKLQDILTDNGLIYIEVPNTMMPNSSYAYFGFEHINYFTATSLINIVHNNGFEVDSLNTFDNGKDIHPFYPVIALTIKKSKKKFEIENDKKNILKVISEYQKGHMVTIEKLNTKIQSLLERTTKGRLAVWGGGIHTSHLLSETLLSPSDICCIYDNDPKKNATKLSGVDVKTFPDSIDEVKKEIDAILISSEASESAIYSQLSYLEQHGIIIYCLYENV